MSSSSEYIPVYPWSRKCSDTGRESGRRERSTLSGRVAGGGSFGARFQCILRRVLRESVGGSWLSKLRVSSDMRGSV